MEQNYTWERAFRFIPIIHHSTDMANLLPPIYATQLNHTQL